jgi:ABC-type nitrate/sulfonate/bicarbonate transport system substrate-binding protein
MNGMLRVLCCALAAWAICSPQGPAIAADSYDIIYGGQYYPEEFLLQGHPQFWSKYGIRVQHILFSSGAENNQALISGKCQINCGSDSKTVELFSVLGANAVLIGTIQKGNRYATVVRADSPYRSWRDLKGKTVATRLGTGAEQILRRYFEKEKDLRWEDFQWVNMKVEDMISALQAGSIEAFTVWEPTCSIAETRGGARILRTYGDVALVPVFLHTTADFARTHRKEIVKFLAAHLDKAEMIQKNPRQAAQIASKAASAGGYDVPAAAFEKVFKKIDFSLDISDGALKELHEAAQLLYNEKKIKSVPQILYDRSFLDEAKKLRKAPR